MAPNPLAPTIFLPNKTRSFYSIGQPEVAAADPIFYFAHRWAFAAPQVLRPRPGGARRLGQRNINDFLFVFEPTSNYQGGLPKPA